MADCETLFSIISNKCLALWFLKLIAEDDLGIVVHAICYMNHIMSMYRCISVNGFEVTPSYDFHKQELFPTIVALLNTDITMVIQLSSW